VSRTLIALLLLGLAGFAPAHAGCALPSEKPMIVAELFFGRDIPGRRPLTEKEWSAFADEIIARQFPDGFTVSDGEGEWRDPVMRKVVRERTKILTVAAAPTAEVEARIARVTAAYRARFRQKSVGILARTDCGAF
jgi:hypothetical protein